jgi:hypothetical protein
MNDAHLQKKKRQKKTRGQVFSGFESNEASVTLHIGLGRSAQIERGAPSCTTRVFLLLLVVGLIKTFTVGKSF